MATPVPSTVTVRRLDTGKVLEVDPASALFWYFPLDSAAFALVRTQPHAGDIPYLREDSNSHWCVPVELVEIPDLPPSNVLPFAPLEARHG